MVGQKSQTRFEHLIKRSAEWAVRSPNTVVVGGLTTLVSVISVAVFATVLAFAEDLANVAVHRWLIVILLPPAIAAPLLLLFTRILRLFYTRGDLLREMVERERSSNERSRRLLATVSHEIRTPLNGILGMGRALLGTSLDVPQRRYATTLQSSADALQRLVNDILAVAQLDRDDTVFQSVSFRLADLIDDVRSLFLPAAKEAGLSLDVHIDESLPAVLVGDDARIRQVLLNLVGNALKFTDEGGITIRVRRLDSAGAPHLRFEVEDSGVGIAPAVVGTVFEEFTQVGAVSAREAGTGLGLAICRRLVRRMRGEIGVDSELGKGSTFWFRVRLPEGRAEDLPEREDANSAVVLPSAEVGLRVLLVEDNKTNRDVATLMLRDLGIKPDSAPNGEIGVGMVFEGGYDVVLMDIQMPVMDGLTATRRIRAVMEPERCPRIIALTANVLPEQREAAFEAGVDDLVEKPLEMNRLREAVLGHVDEADRTQSNGALERLVALTAGDLTMVETMVQEHLENVQDLLAEVRSGLASQDGDSVCRAAHTIKSSTAMFGARKVSAQAAKVEMAALRDDLVACPALAEELETLAAEAHETLQRSLDALLGRSRLAT